MKKSIAALVLALAGTACQPQAAVTNEAAVATEMPVAEAASLVTAAEPAAAPPRPAPSEPAVAPSSALRALVQSYDFAPLLQTVRTDDEQFNSHAQNGFFGPEHYRIEVVFSNVRRDPNNPLRYHLGGKNRYKGLVTPFTGTFTIAQVVDQPRYSAREIAEIKAGDYYEGESVENQPNMHTAVGDFELREDPARRASGIFRGRLALDWHVEENGTVTSQVQTRRTLTQGGGIKYEGTWTSNASHRVSPVVWVEDIFAYARAQNVLEDFEIGGREVNFNPKYAKLGWNGYMANDEWWAEPAAATSSL